jgi:hypothetical protein
MMAKAKTASEPKPTPKGVVLLAWLLFGPLRSATWSIVAVLVFTASAAALWWHVSSRVVAGPEYQVTSRNVEITPPPQWIHSDIAAEVVRSLSLDAPLSILDDKLSERIYNGFAAHPWVAEVERVTKRHPAHVRVDLVYRRPVCMVEVASASGPASSAAAPLNLLPVDVKGVLLPSGDMPPAERERYPRLKSIATAPLGPPGVKWGDGRVTGGAEVAAALVEVWSELSLAAIVPSASPERGPKGDEYTFEIFTRGGTRILWGRSPATWFPGETPVNEKIAYLRSVRQTHRTLDGAREIDVRHWRQAIVDGQPIRMVERPTKNKQK